jgi:hypothetical protein
MRNVGGQLFVGLLAASAVLSPLTARAANLYALGASIIDLSNNNVDYNISKIDPTGTATNIVTGRNVPFQNLAFDSTGNLFTIRQRNSNTSSDVIIKIDTTGTLTTLATAQNRSFDGLTIDGSDNLFTTETLAGGGSISKIDTNNGTATRFATAQRTFLGSPELVFDNSGNLFATGNRFSRFEPSNILKFGATGTETTFATSQLGGNFGSLTFDQSGNLFAIDSTIRNNSININDRSIISKFDTNGTANTFATSQQGSGFVDLEFDGSGNLFASTYNSATKQSTIGKFDTNGIATTFATLQDALFDLTFDENGNLFVIGSPVFNGDGSNFDPSGKSTISKIDTAGTVTTFFTPAPGTFFNDLVLSSSNIPSTGLVFTPSNTPTTPPNNPSDPNNPNDPTTVVPEPFTIIGTLVGGTAAIRLRKKLKSDKV